MANKADRFYYENFIAAADCACQAADYLVECLTTYDIAQIRMMLSRMHSFEHDADEKKHEMNSALAKAFVTPLDREDLAALSQTIDEVSDALEEVIRKIYIGQVKEIMPEAITFAKQIAVCCRMVKEMLVEFENFKKPEKLHKMIIEINRLEGDCDVLYLEAMIRSRKANTETLDIISWSEIFNALENCADCCEHVADSVEMVVMKNT